MIEVKVSNPKGSNGHARLPVLIEMIADPGVFTPSNNCPQSLAAGASCKIEVTFNPTAPMKQMGTHNSGATYGYANNTTRDARESRAQVDRASVKSEPRTVAGVVSVCDRRPA